MPLSIPRPDRAFTAAALKGDAIRVETPEDRMTLSGCLKPLVGSICAR